MIALLQSRLTTYGTLLVMLLLVGMMCADCAVTRYMDG